VPQQVLVGDRDFTDEEWRDCLEDYQRGFALLSPADWEKFQVPDEPIVYRTREKLSRNCVKVSASMVGKWVTTNTSRKIYPKGYLEDDFGFTPQAVAVFRNMMRYTCTRRFKVNPDTNQVDWEALDRDKKPITDPGTSEENPDYVLCSLYWQKAEEMWLDYCDRLDWIEDYRKRRSIESIPFEGEHVAEFEDVRQELRSDFKVRGELAEHQVKQALVQKFNALTQELVEIAADKGIEANARAKEAFAQGFQLGDATPSVEEENDLWSEE
jgi:hypothetical protein